MRFHDTCNSYINDADPILYVFYLVAVGCIYSVYEKNIASWTS
jgi:hypothetical protein